MLLKKIYPIADNEILREKQNNFTDFLQDKLIISSHSFLHILEIKEVLFVEASGNYSKIHVSDGRIITASKTLKDFENHLKKHQFYRVHSGFLVNLPRLRGIRKNGSFTMLFDKDKEVPISSTYKKEIMSKFLLKKI